MRLVVSVLAASALVGAGVLMSGQETRVSAETFEFTVQATGDNEVPPVDSPGSATGEFTFDDETNELDYRVTVEGLSEDQVTAAHIHSGNTGENGPVLYTLSDEGFTETEGTIELSDEDAQALMDGELYLNVHSVDNPDGFARVQLELPELEGTPEASASPQMTTTPAADRTAQASPTSEVESNVGPPSTGSGGLADTGASGRTALLVLLGATTALGASALLLIRGRSVER